MPIWPVDLPIAPSAHGRANTLGPLVLIIDDFAVREHTTTQSYDLYSLVSDGAIAGEPLILTSDRAPKDRYPLFPNPAVAESLFDRLINTSHQILMSGPSYRLRKNPVALQRLHLPPRHILALEQRIPPPAPRPTLADLVVLDDFCSQSSHLLITSKAHYVVDRQ